LFAYIDESGHTGSNLFDDAQPTFYYGALACRHDFDLVHGAAVNGLAERAGKSSLHGAELGHELVEAIAPALVHVVLQADARFFLSKIKKLDLAAIKLFDTVFDPAENVAVPWQAYNMVALRNILLLKLAHLLDRDLLERFWASLLERDEERSRKDLVEVLQRIDDRVGALPDARSRQVLNEAFRWVIAHPEVLQYHSIRRVHLRGHMPNAVGFPDMLRSLHGLSKKWKRDVRQIKVDRQSQFNATQKMMHEMFARASPGKVPLWIGMDPVEFQAVPGSKLMVTASATSPGIQVVDVFLWLIRQLDKGVVLGPEASELFRKLGHRIRVWEMSLDKINEWTTEHVRRMDAAEITPEMAAKATELIALGEKRRQEEMAEYEASLVSKTPVPQLPRNESSTDERAD
jgi:hypothetical protein